MEWLDVADAPIDTPVKLGRWENLYGSNGGGIQWITRVGTPFETQRILWFWKWTVRDKYLSEYTHYQLLPEPPKAAP